MPDSQPPVPAPQDAGISAVKEGLNVIFGMIRVIMALLLAGFFLSGIRNIEQFENGIILRFGAVHGGVQEEPGPVFALPYPIDELIRIPAKRTQTLESNTFWYKISDYEQSTGITMGPPNSLTPGVDGYLLTAERSILHAQCALKYRIRDTIPYVFSVAAMDRLLVSLLDNATLKAIGAENARHALENKNQLSQRITSRLQASIDEFQLGIEIDPVDVRLSWPRQLTDQISEVVKANQKVQQDLAEARVFADLQTAEADSQSTKTILTAESWATQHVSRAAADAGTFAKLYPLYKANPEAIQQTLYQDRMRKIMTEVDEIYIIEQKENREIRLNIPRVTRETKKVERGDKGGENR